MHTDCLCTVGSSSKGVVGGGLTAPGTRDKVSRGRAWNIVLRGHPHEGLVGTGPMTRQQRGGDIGGGVAGGTILEPVDRGKSTCSERTGVLHSGERGIAAEAQGRDREICCAFEGGLLLYM